MNEALILEKLDNLSSEIQSLKSEVQALKEAKQVVASSAQAAQPAAMPLLAGFEGKYNQKDVELLVENLLLSVGDLNSMLFKVKAANELVHDIEPVAKQVYPHVIRFFADLEGQLTLDDVVALLQKIVTAVPAFNESIGLLKSGLELKDDLMPVAQILYPKFITFFAELEGQVTLEDVTALVGNVITAIPAFNESIGLLKSGIELKDDLMPVIQILYPKVIKLFHDLQLAIEQSSGIIQVATTAGNKALQFSLSDTQAAGISRIIEEFDLNNVKPVSPIGAIKQLMDPEVQKSLGAAFMLLQAVGACVQVLQNK